MIIIVVIIVMIIVVIMLILMMVIMINNNDFRWYTFVRIISREPHKLLLYTNLLKCNKTGITTKEK